MSIKYRSDIDGLRAVAVLSVLFFHSGFSQFSGGYVGVDVFFVISGYLITTIIVREIANNVFSISNFYERRFRRILPALAVVIVASLLVGILLLPPSGVVELGKSAISTTLFVSNMFFYFESGYFAGAAEMKPLLHTWSLAVEEQYYIFFPLLLVFIAKIDSKHYLRWLVFLGGGSLVACIILTVVKPSIAFYGIPTRAWELFIGSILALNVIPTLGTRSSREFYSLVGIGMILYSIFQFTPETSFPGFTALLPTLGTAFIIHSGSAGFGFIHKALSLRPVVFIGLISYSLYLWHWPVIVYTKIFFIKELSGFVLIAMLLVIFLLAILSWKYVESPFRKKSIFKNKQSMLLASFTTSAVVIVCGLSLVMNQGFPNRLTNNISLDSKDTEWERWGLCEKVTERLENNKGLCDIGADSKLASFILWGDSHARSLISGVNLSANNIGVSGKIATQAGCPPLLSIERINRTSCDSFNKSVLDFISASQNIEIVILAARWAISTKGTRYKKEEAGPAIVLIDLKSLDSNNLSNVELFDIGIRRTIVKLHSLGKKVVLVNPIPEVGYDVPSAYFIGDLTGQDINKIIAPTTKEYMKRTEEVVSTFQKINENMSVEIAELDAYLCNENYCRVLDDNGIPLYRDDDHLSTYGSKYISRTWNKILNN